MEEGFGVGAELRPIEVAVAVAIRLGEPAGDRVRLARRGAKRLAGRADEQARAGSRMLGRGRPVVFGGAACQRRQERGARQQRVPPAPPPGHEMIRTTK
jgi:hypothetical protein